MRSRARDLSTVRRPGPTVLLAALVALVACSPPPRGTGSEVDVEPSSAGSAGESERPVSRSGTYELEKEGQFPPPDEDVVFEEDELPPAPEDVEAAPIDDRTANPESVGERGEVLEPIEPTVTPPVEREVPERIPAEPPAVGARGFRVQLVASGERVEAEKLALEAQTRLTVPVYVEFEAPYYKVRAGDFTDRAEALRLRERARANGYSEAWVVTTEIRVRPGGGGR